MTIKLDGIGGAVASVTVNFAQTGLIPRALDNINDSALTLGDALVSAIACATGKQVISESHYIIQTPHTGTTIRTFLLDNPSNPTSRS